MVDYTTPHLKRVEDEARRPPRPEFAGLSYERASRLGAALVAEAHRTGSWLALPEALAELRSVLEVRVRQGLPRQADDAGPSTPRSPEYMGNG